MTRVGAGVGAVAGVCAIVWVAVLLQPAAGSAAAGSPGQVSGCTPPSDYSPAKAQAWQAAHGCRAVSIPAAQAGKAKAAARARARGLVAAGTQPGKLARPASAGRIGTGTQLGGVPAPFSPAVTRITNMYLDLTADGKEYLDVYAGANTSKPSQGVLFIEIENPANGATTVDAYPLPKAGGIASLVSHTTTSIVVRDADGDRFTFNIQAGTWS
ncbi:MAG: hypothetical protein ABSA02_26215 [Trebonia sp.]